MPLTSILLEYSSDPVSDTTPSWVTVSQAELRSVEWWAGVNEEGDDLEPGGASIVLVNVARKWEPFFALNVIDTHQRFRLTLNGVQEGVWFITSISLDYPGNTEWSVVEFQCADGFEILALDHLLSLDPPEAESYEDVVNFDEPWGYWRLGEQEGTKASARIARVWRGRGANRRKIKRRRGTNYSTREEAGGASGPAGVYKNTPSLGQPGLILGDADTCVRLGTAGGVRESVRVLLADTDDLQAFGKVTIECWYDSTAAGQFLFYINGPIESGGPDPIWSVSVTEVLISFDVQTTAGTRSLNVIVIAPGVHHMACVYDGSNMQVWHDGVLEEESVFGSSPIIAAGTGTFISIISGATDGDYGIVDEAAVYEHGLKEERVLAHYQAGAERGYVRQPADERIGALVESGLWTEDGVVSGYELSHDVVPRMMFGQSRLDEIAETMHAEGPQAVFYFNGAGNPAYLGWEWRSTSDVYSEVQATFGQEEHGEIPVDGLEPVYDHETYNVVQASCEGSGELVEIEDATAAGKRGRRVLDDYTGLLLAEHMNTESLASALLATYKDPVRRVEEITVSGWDDQRLDKLLSLDIGDMVRVNWSGETGARNGQVANILRKHKSLDNTERPHVLRCTYRLSRGFDALEGSWRAGIAGWSEAGTTTTAA